MKKKRGMEFIVIAAVVFTDVYSHEHYTLEKQYEKQRRAYNLLRHKNYFAA